MRLCIAVNFCLTLLFMIPAGVQALVVHLPHDICLSADDNDSSSPLLLSYFPGGSNNTYALYYGVLAAYLADNPPGITILPVTQSDTISLKLPSAVIIEGKSVEVVEIKMLDKQNSAVSVSNTFSIGMHKQSVSLEVLNNILEPFSVAHILSSPDVIKHLNSILSGAPIESEQIAVPQTLTRFRENVVTPLGDTCIRVDPIEIERQGTEDQSESVFYRGINIAIGESIEVNDDAKASLHSDQPLAIITPVPKQQGMKNEFEKNFQKVINELNKNNRFNEHRIFIGDPEKRR